MKIIIHHGKKILFDNVRIADNLWSRLTGFMFKDIPKDYDGILLSPCNSIHTCFMRFPLDVVFMSKTGEIVKVVRNLRPWRQTWIYFKAHKVLELPAGKLPIEIKEGQVLEVSDV